MNYQHDIFVSYAHGHLWTPWVRESFVPRLQGFLEVEVGRLELFVDDQIQSGARWEGVLKQKVARSRLMLALISASYFQRDWCRREMALILEREKEQGLIGLGHNYGLLIPVRLGDGVHFPDLVGQVQHHDFEEYADPDLPAGSQRASECNRSLRNLARTIARTLSQVPECRQSWEDLTGDEFFPQLASKPLRVTTPPRLVV